MADENAAKETCTDIKNTTPSTNIAGLADSVKAQIEDTELDELLDSALEEFGKPPPSASEKGSAPSGGGDSAATTDAGCIKMFFSMAKDWLALVILELTSLSESPFVANLLPRFSNFSFGDPIEVDIDILFCFLDISCGCWFWSI
ncbi:hypothetical protein LSAT2_004263 [Lamellibrachia satsuma]|nr:hypothetical protein LSAT2_004263 [Lamellibrachia satsuma]